jgi:ectoine hydroxylase-related dioxygenase (phytanoyl-CoA dioxygenase family)
LQQSNTNKFNTDGYQVARGVIDPVTIDKVRQVLEEVLETTVDEMKALGIRVGTKNMVADINRLLDGPNARNIDQDLRTIMTGQYPSKIRMDARLLEILKSPQLQNLLSSALCSANLCMHMPPMARFVYPGNSSAGVPAHQDVAYNEHLSDFITLWIPLVDIDSKCGGVTVYPGSDNVQQNTVKLNHGVWFDDIDVSGTVPVDCAPMAKGDVLIFNRFLAHKSMPNLSNRIRFSLDLRFFTDNDYSEKHYLNMTTWEVIAPND